MNKIILAVLAVVILVVIAGGVYVVREGEQVLITQFGAPVSEQKDPGLHFKIPFIQDVHRFESRIMKWDGDPNQIPTKDKRYIWIDTTARWRIKDPLKFFKTVATERGAMGPLDDIVESAVRDAVSGHQPVELVRGSEYQPPADGDAALPEEEKIATGQLAGREAIMDGILKEARNNTPEYGIELIDVRIKRVGYVKQVLKSVYERMISERKKVAAEYRSEGEGEKADILGQMKKELKRIESEAQKASIETRGRADAEAARIYAEAFNQDPEFYAFLRSLESFREAIGENGRLVLTTDSDFYRYLKTFRSSPQ